MAVFDFIPKVNNFEDRKPKPAPDQEYKSIDPGGRPITGMEEQIRETRKTFVEPWAEPIGNAFSRATRRIGDKFVPGTPFMNTYRARQDQKAQQDRSFEQKMILRKQNPKGIVRERAGEMFQAAVKKYRQDGDQAVFKYAEDSITKMIKMSGYAPQEFNLPGTVDISNVDPDPFYLDSNRPNPFPEIEIAADTIMGTAASLYGATNTGARQFANVFARGAKIGAKAPVPGAWKFLASVAGGSLAVGSAYFGYELGLDLYNEGSKAKAKLEGRDPKTYSMNRPGIGSRLYRTADLAATDALLGTVVMGFRPAYNGLRNFTRKNLAGVKGEKIDKIVAGQKLVDKFPTGGYGVEGRFPSELGGYKLFPGTPTLTGGGNKHGLEEVEELRRGLFPFYWGNIERGAGEMPIQGTPYSIATAGNPIMGTGIETGGKFPYIGGGIKINLEEQGEMLINLYHNMFAAYAPTVSTHALMSSNILMARNKTAARYLANLKRKLNRFRRHGKETGYTIDAGPIRATMEEMLDNVPKTKKIFDQDGRILQGYDIKSPEFGLNDLTRFPEAEKQFYNWINENLQSVVGSRSKFSIVELEKMFKDIEYYAKRYKDNPDVMDSLTKLKQSTEASLGTIENSEARRLLDDYDNYAANGMLLFDSAAGRKFGGVIKNGFTLRLAEQGPKAADDLFATAFDANNPSTIRAFKNIVGPDVFNQTTRRFLTDAFENSVEAGEKTGIKQINFNKFKAILGLNETQGNKYASLKEMLPGASPTTGGGRAPTATDFGKFDPDNFATIRPGGLIPGAVMEGVESNVAKLPTVTDLETWVAMVEDVFKYGIPDISTFIARRAQISGLRGAIKSFMPLGNIQPVAHGGTAALAAGGGGFFGGTGLGLVFLGTLLTRAGGKVLTNPLNMRVFKNAIDYKLPERARNAAMIKMFNLFKPEIEQIDQELEALELESMRPSKRRNFYQDVKEGIGNKFNEIMPNFGDQSNAQPVQQTVPQGPEVIEEQSTQMASAAPVQSMAPVAGSSLDSSSTLNPGAAQALYQGDTDGALAEQYGNTQTAAQGGLMTLRRS